MSRTKDDGLVGLAGLFMTTFLRAVLGIAVLIVFTSALTLFAVLGVVMGPFTTCAIALSRAVGSKRQWN